MKKENVLHQSISGGHQQPAPCCLERKNCKGKGLQQLQETDTNSQTELREKRGAHPRERRAGPMRKRDVREMKHS